MQLGNFLSDLNSKMSSTMGSIHRQLEQSTSPVSRSSNLSSFLSNNKTSNPFGISSSLPVNSVFNGSMSQFEVMSLILTSLALVTGSNAEVSNDKPTVEVMNNNAQVGNTIKTSRPYTVPTNQLDNAYYLNKYTDVNDAVNAGTMPSAKAHWDNFGRSELRYLNQEHQSAVESSRADFNEQAYLEKYPDVKAAIDNGTMPDAWSHFIWHGVFENREIF